MWGGDFAHQNGETYDRLDEILQSLDDEIFNSDELPIKFIGQYSTISKYFADVQAEARRLDIEWDV